MIFASSINFVLGSLVVDSDASTFSTWLNLNDSGIKSTNALAPLDMSEPHEAHHLELPPSVALWSREDRAVIVKNKTSTLARVASFN